ncbi:N-6 DNA methylase [Ancylobacter terrae]|uniref:N-6 DNA methylase n=1 Tax=Ancylobacter sp. sgz301288 TaxID=3342077 RepID=UPI00385D5F38
MALLSQKHSGAYFTPDPVVAALVRWAVSDPADRMLDPSCGDGRFLAGHRNSVGIEQDPRSAATAVERAPWALVHEGDFFTWAGETAERFECAAGNPPFIRYQTFKGAVRARALNLCLGLGAEFTGLTSSWAPFLVATASLLKPGGRMAFVVPAEIGHAPYSAPLLEYLVANFSRVQVVAVREKLFPDLSEDCWLLYADGHGGRTSSIRFTALDRFDPAKAIAPLAAGEDVPVTEWRETWGRRLRPFVLPASIRAIYARAAAHPASLRFGTAAQIGIGYVSGANDFFHLKPSLATKLGIPAALLQPAVRNGRALPAKQLTKSTIQQWHASDEPFMLLRLPKVKVGELPKEVRRYLDSSAGHEAREAYKCRVREPWFSVPDVQQPDYFLSYMSGVSANLVRNAGGATCTNSVHCVRVRDAKAMQRVAKHWTDDFVALSREIEGHPLGGGMLKLEPREATRILVPAEELAREHDDEAMAEAVTTMQRWRHYV